MAYIDIKLVLQKQNTSKSVISSMQDSVSEQNLVSVWSTTTDLATKTGSGLEKFGLIASHSERGTKRGGISTGGRMFSEIEQKYNVILLFIQYIK